MDRTLHREIAEYAALLKDDLKRAGIEGFRLRSELDSGHQAENFPIVDMGHTAGTTRMGASPATSVVNADCEVHGVKGLSIAGASTFPTSGHANPTLVIMALTIRLADHLTDRIIARRTAELASQASAAQAGGSTLVAVTGASGNLGREVVARLLERGYRVRGQFRNTVPSEGRVEWQRFDMADPDLPQDTLAAFVDGAVAVINLAGNTSVPAEMMTVNVTNLERLARVSAAAGVRYFGQASSMVVYGSPRRRIVTENTERIDLSKPLRHQYFAEPVLTEYARTKRLAEDALSDIPGDMHIDLCRIAVAQGPAFMADTLHWGRFRRLFALYRNSHFITSRDTSRAITHLMEHALARPESGVFAWNVCNRHSLTFAAFYASRGRSTAFTMPLVLDVLKNWKMSRSLSWRYPMGAFRMDDSRLRATGFRPEDPESGAVCDVSSVKQNEN